MVFLIKLNNCLLILETLIFLLVIVSTFRGLTMLYPKRSDRIEPQLDPISWLAWSLNECAPLWRVVYGASATERPLERYFKEKGICSWFCISILSLRYDISC